jgi:hypothetical protein
MWPRSVGRGWPAVTGTGLSPRGIPGVMGPGVGVGPGVGGGAGLEVGPGSRWGRARGGGGGEDPGAGVAELGQCGQGGVPVDRGVGAGLGLVPAQDVLAGLEGFLHGPAAPGDGDQVGQGGQGEVGDPADEVGQLVGPGDQAPYQ